MRLVGNHLQRENKSIAMFDYQRVMVDFPYNPKKYIIIPIQYLQQIPTLNVFIGWLYNPIMVLPNKTEKQIPTKKVVRITFRHLFRDDYLSIYLSIYLPIYLSIYVCCEKKTAAVACWTFGSFAHRYVGLLYTYMDISMFVCMYDSISI